MSAAHEHWLRRSIRFCGCAIVLSLCATLQAGAGTSVRLLLDRPVDGAAAPIAVALAQNLFRAEGLEPAVNVARGSVDAIARVAGGESDLAIADINTLIRYRDGDKVVPLKAVFVLNNRAAYALIARRSRGIAQLGDVAGKTVGVAEGDLSVFFWAAVAKANGIALGKVKVEKIGAAVREPMLAAGQVDAMTGQAFLSAVNLRDRGIPAGDLAVFRFADYGCEAYGDALIVNPKFAASNPDLVRGAVRALIEGVTRTASDPAKAIDSVLAQMENGSRDLETARLNAVIKDNLITVEVQKNGIGVIDAARFEEALGQMAEDFKFRKRPALDEIFDAAFLPPRPSRSAP